MMNSLTNQSFHLFELIHMDGSSSSTACWQEATYKHKYRVLIWETVKDTPALDGTAMQTKVCVSTGEMSSQL